MPRWPHAQGRLRLSGADFWETRREALAGVRATAREERARQAAVRRALRRWDSAFANAERLHVLRGAPAPTPASVAAWRAIAGAAAECARVQAPGGPWTPVRESAERAVALLRRRILPARTTGAGSERSGSGAAAGLVSRSRGGSLSCVATAPGVIRPARNPRSPTNQFPKPRPAPDALIHVAPRTRPPSLPPSFLRIHRISFSTSLLHITHTCTYWCARPSCVTKGRVVPRFGNLQAVPSGCEAALVVTTSLVLVHSPLVGRDSWEAVAASLSRRGERVSLVDLTNALGGGPPLLASRGRRDYRRDHGPSHPRRPQSCRPPSSACRTATRGVEGCVYIDARLPHPGASWIAANSFCVGRAVDEDEP